MKIWMPRDIKCATLFNTVCNVSEEDAIAFSGISENRLFTWKNLGWITEEHDEKKSWYRTTIKGREIFEEKTLIHPYVSNSYRHDKGLFDIYASKSDSERDSWLTESELRMYASERDIDLTDMSVTDGAYRNDNGDLVCVEIITISYSDEDKAMKERFVEEIGGQYATYKI